MSGNSNGNGGLSDSAMEYLHAGGSETSYADGNTILHRGDPGRAFYVITSGEVEIRLANSSHGVLTLARMGVGASFGEMSLIKGDPVSADVVARGETTILEYPGDRFEQALGESPPLRDHILTRLSDNIRNTNSEVWKYFQRSQVFSALMDSGEDTGPVVAESPAMRRVSKAIPTLAQEAQAILLTGARGTGKFYVAKKIHEKAENREAPFIVVDCARVASGEASRLIFGSSKIEDFKESDSGGFAPHLLVRGTLHVADRGTLVLRHIEALDRSTLEILSCYIEAISTRDNIFPQTRIIGTTCQELKRLSENDEFPAQLVEQLSANILELPRLQSRKKDILPLARQILANGNGHEKNAEKPHFNKSAERMLLSLEYRYNNVAELTEAVQFAARYADGTEIGAEHIFTGPKDRGNAIEYDLGETPWVRWFIQRSVLSKVQLGVFSFFAAIAVFCLTFGETVLGRTANGLVWGVWWPSLVVLFLFMGRIWCTVCPISSSGRMLRKFRGLDLAPPQWIKKHSGWLMAALFFTIVWVEHVFHMTSQPFATGMLLLGLMTICASLSVIYKREIWCRYLCPLGALAAGYSVSAAVHVRANQGVCSSQCKTHECVKGTATDPGCPVYHHPLYVRDAHFCKLCCACLRNCPHGSARPYLRPLLQDVWRVDDISVSMVPFALAVFFLAMVMLASHWLTWITTAAGFTVTALAAIGFAAALNFALPRLLANSEEPDPGVITRVGFALLVLGWGPFMAFHLENIPGLGALMLQVAEDSFWPRSFGTTKISLLTLFQFAAIAVSAIFCGLTLSRIRARFTKQGTPPSTYGWRILLIICGLYFLAAVSLILPQGVHL